jgi:CubicO group peptidase (beta-lactamase class C family)
MNGHPGIPVACAAVTRQACTTDFHLCEPENRFEVGSITKLFTGILLCEAALDGLCDLDSPLSEFIPSRVPSFFGKQVTLRQLANHTSSLPRLPLSMYPRVAGPQPYAGWDRERTLAALARTPLLRSPGSLYSYSNFGFAILGLAIETMRNRPYSDLVQDLTARLGCPEVRLPTPSDVCVDLAGTDARGKQVSRWDMGAFAAAGGITSTLGGLVAFARKALTPLNSPGLADSMTERIHARSRVGHLKSMPISIAVSSGAFVVSALYPESVFTPLMGIGAASYVGTPLYGLAPTIAWVVASSANHLPIYIVGQRLGFGLIATGIAQNLRKNRGFRDMGVGWHITKTPNGKELLWHNGMTSGFSSFLGLYPASGSATIVLSATARPVDALALKIGG